MFYETFSTLLLATLRLFVLFSLLALPQSIGTEKSPRLRWLATPRHKAITLADAGHLSMTCRLYTTLFMGSAPICAYLNIFLAQLTLCLESNLLRTEPGLDYPRGLGPGLYPPSSSDVRKRPRFDWESMEDSEPKRLDHPSETSDGWLTLSLAPPGSTNYLKDTSTTDQPAPERIHLDQDIAPNMHVPSVDFRGVARKLALSDSRDRLLTSNAVTQMQTSPRSFDAPGSPLPLISKPNGRIGAQEVGAMKRPNESVEKFSTIGLDPPNVPMNQVTQFPKYAGDPETIEYFTLLFSKSIKENEQLFFSQKWAYDRDDSNMMFVSFKIPPNQFESIAWVKGDQGRKWQSGRLHHFFESLTKWILLSHMQFLEYYNIEPNEQATRCQALFDWLHSEIFEQTTCPPIFGKFSGKVDQYELSYRPIQQVLIRHLTRGLLKAEYAYILSLNVVGIWYKSFQKDFWSKMFRSDEVFWKLMKNLTGKRKKYTENNYQRPAWGHLRPAFPHQKYLGNFQTMEVATIVPKAKHASMFRILAEELPQESHPSPPFEKRILNTLDEAFTHFRESRPIGKIVCANLPVLVYTKARRGRDVRDAYTVRLATSNGKTLPREAIKSRLSLLLQTLSYILRKLRYFIPVHGRLTQEELVVLNEDFMEWFYKNLFFPDASLPVMGPAAFQIEPEPHNTRLDLMDRFGPLQAYCIEYLARPLAGFNLLQPAVTILGYWFLNECPKLWNESFVNEEGYFYKVAQLLMTNGQALSTVTLRKSASPRVDD